MEIQFQTKTIPFCREIFRQTKVFQVSGESIVPDVNDDIGQILWSSAQLCLKSKDINTYGVSVTGCAEITVLYLNESREKILPIRISKEFSVDFDVPGLEPDAKAHIRLTSMGVQARAVNSRKVAAQLTIRSELVCWEEDSLSFCAGVEDAAALALQTREIQTEILLPSQICEKSFVISQQIPLADEAEDAQILFSQIALANQDCQMIGGKVLVKGTAEVSIVCVKDDASSLRTIEQSIPFTVLLDIAEESCEPEHILFETTAVYASLSDAINGSRVIELEIHALVQAGFEQRQTVSYLEDLFSTRYPLAPQEESIRLTGAKEEQTIRASSEERLEWEGNVKEVISVFPQLLSFSVKEGRMAATAAVSVLARGEDESLACGQKLLSFDFPLPEGDVELCFAELLPVEARAEGNAVALSGTVAFKVRKTETRELSCLVSAELDQDAPYDLSRLPSLTAVVCRDGDLWSMAKAYHSSVSAIEELRERYSTPASVWLIPRI